MKEHKGKQNKVSSTHLMCSACSQYSTVFVRVFLDMSLPLLQEILDLAFSITYDVEEDSLNFIAPSRTDVSLRTFSSLIKVCARFIRT